MAVTIAGPTSLAGAEVQLLLLAGGRRWCAAIHLRTGALLSARWEQPTTTLAPLQVACARVAGDQGEADPVRPEEVTLAGAPRPVGHASRRRAEKWVRPVLHPPGQHLLGFPGPATPYWALTGARPSLAVVAPPVPPVVERAQCRFRWHGQGYVLPVLPEAIESCPPHPRRLVVTLSSPRAGHCYKVVAALL